jgi:ribosomal protein S18 acetylase RimI-like enzyme
MENDFVIRKATDEDIPFLVDTIVAAEKSGTSTFTYTTIFGLTETEARNYISKMLYEDIDGCELSVSGFVIAENFGRIAGAVGAWVEGSEGIPSVVLKGNLLQYVLPSHCIERAARLTNVIRDLHIEYIVNTIQIGLVYVAPEARGKGLVSLMLEHKIGLLREKFTGIHEVYIQVFGNNIPAIKAYEKAGFKIIFEKNAELAETTNYMPYTKKVSMKKYI